MIAEEAAAVERRLIHLRDLVEGARRELTRGIRKGLEDKVRKELEGKVRGWESERGVLEERRAELEEEPIELTITPAAKRAHMKPLKVRWDLHEEYGGNMPDTRRRAK